MGTPLPARTAAPAAGPAEAPAPQPGRGRDRRPLWLMLPAAVLLVVIVLVPFALAFWMSFTQLDQYSLRQWLGAPFAGLANYAQAVSTSGLLHSLWVSVGFSLLTTAIAAPLGVLAALTVNSRFPGRGLVRSVYLIPYVIPAFVTGTFWRVALLPGGAVNHILKAVGLGGDAQWLIGARSFWTLVGVDVWASWAFIYLMTLAGLQTISNELYEAADIDGATWWQKVVRVVLPQVKGQLSLGLLLATLSHFNNFTLPYLLFGMPAPNAVDVLPMNIYQTSFQQFGFGLGAAMSVATLVIMTIPAVAYLRTFRLNARPQEVEA